MNEIVTSVELKSKIPLSPGVKLAVDKLGEGLRAAINANESPDAGELFDIVLMHAAAFFAVVPLNKHQRRVVVGRFEDALKHQLAQQHPAKGASSH